MTTSTSIIDSHILPIILHYISAAEGILFEEASLKPTFRIVGFLVRMKKGTFCSVSMMMWGVTELELLRSEISNRRPFAGMIPSLGIGK